MSWRHADLLNTMKRILIIIAMIISGVTSAAQTNTENRKWKLPSSLENPASESIAQRYENGYRAMRRFNAGIYGGIGVAAVGTGYMLHNMSIGSSMDDAFKGLMVGEGAILVGLTASAVCTVASLSRHRSLVRIEDENAFLHIPGNTQEMWDYQRAQKKYSLSKAVMWTSGIATAGLAGFTAVGMARGLKDKDDDLYLAAEGTLWLGAATAAAFAAGWVMNSNARKTLSRLEPFAGADVTSLTPFIAPMPTATPASGSASYALVSGVALTARF